MTAFPQQAEFSPPLAPRRHRFGLEDVSAIIATGVLGDGRIELIDGEIIDMPADGELHLRWTAELTYWLASRLDRSTHRFLPNSTLSLSYGCAPSPDFYVYPAALEEGQLLGGEVALLIEQAHSSLGRDLGEKARLYAQHGVRDYWVIDLEARRTHVHRGPGSEGYAIVQTVERDQQVEALLIPGLALRIADLPRVGG